MLGVIDLFRDQDTVDELGLSAIWDALADLLFPGTGTVQTRARYFLFVPWIFRTVETQRIPSTRAKAAVRRLEVKLIGSLLAGGTDQLGIIGRQAGAGLKRMPSAIYWSGLRRLGIRRLHGSVDQLLRTYDATARSAREALRDDDGEIVESVIARWDPYLPDVPDDFLDTPTRFELPLSEAAFLRDRVRDSGSGSLLDVLLSPEVRPSAMAFPWQHPDVRRFPESVRRTLSHAQRYSEAMHGAALLYNLQLAREKGVDEWSDTYEERLVAWADLLEDQGGAHAAWPREEFWEMVTAAQRVHPLARAFVDSWSQLLSRDGFQVHYNPRALALVTARELSVAMTKSPLVAS